MPSKTPKQARTMAAAAHSPSFAKKVGIPTDVAEEFNAADTGTGIIKPKKKPPAKGSHGGPASQFGLPKSPRKPTFGKGAKSRA